MAEPYNLTVISGQDSIYGLMTGANILSGYYIGYFTVILTFLISYVAFKKYDSEKAMAGASFITALIAVMLRVLTWIPDTWMFGTFILAGLSLIALRWGK